MRSQNERKKGTFAAYELSNQISTHLRPFPEKRDSYASHIVYATACFVAGYAWAIIIYYWCYYMTVLRLILDH